MEDLDSLLEDLGRGKSSSPNKTPPASSGTNGNRDSRPPSRPISSRVDLNELEDLMTDLAAPTAKKTPEPTPVIQANHVEERPVSNNWSNERPVSERPVSERPVSTFERPVSTINNSPPSNNGASQNSSSNSNTVDDLEALMESLNVASNNRGSRRQTQTTPAKAAEPPKPFEPKPEPVRATPASATFNSTPVNNNPTPARSNNFASSSPTPVSAQQQNTPVKGDDLDKLLSNLTTQMDNIEPDNPASRGQCNTCKGAILGEMMQALGKCYHPEHFTCGNCHQPLGTRNFFEQNGLPHCGDCYQTMYCPKCAHCNGAILDRCITALGKKWHPEHFICGQCLQPFPNGNFFERDGRPYCENDFFSLFATKCGACHEPIKGDCINALGQQWHPEHFVCTYCGKAFSGTFFEHSGKPYCEAHYHQQSGSCCAGCGKPITGRCVNALEKKWHPEHFVCAFCMNPLAGGSFTEKNNKAYCKECHSKLFGS